MPEFLNLQNEIIFKQNNEALRDVSSIDRMTRARTNIESEPTRRNVMEADATISKHAYEMQPAI